MTPRTGVPGARLLRGQAVYWARCSRSECPLSAGYCPCRWNTEELAVSVMTVPMDGCLMTASSRMTRRFLRCLAPTVEFVASRGRLRRVRHVLRMGQDRRNIISLEPCTPPPMQALLSGFDIGGSGREIVKSSMKGAFWPASFWCRFRLLRRLRRHTNCLMWGLQPRFPGPLERWR